VLHFHTHRRIDYPALQIREPWRERGDQEETLYPGQSCMEGFGSLIVPFDKIHFRSEHPRCAPGIADQRAERGVSGQQLPG